MVSADAQRLWTGLRQAWSTIRSNDGDLPAALRRPSAVGAWVIAPLAVVLVAATLLSGALGFLLARQSDEHNEAERRLALGEAIKEYRAKTGDAALDANLIHLLAQASGLKGLRWQSEPDGNGREMQSVVENGRFVGWFSWDRQSPAADALARLWPLVGLALVCLGGFAGLAISQVRRSRSALAVSLEQVRALATDRLTGLPNARTMLDRLERALRNRNGARTVTFLRLDLDRFEDVDEGLGRVAAERLLADVTARLRSALPASTTIGAFGQGRFAAILIGEMDLGMGAAADALAAMARPFAVGGEDMAVRAAIGAASTPRHGTRGEELVRRAELALESAKKGARSGPGQVVTFDPSMETAFQERQFFKRELKRAMVENALTVHYQPIVAANGYRVVGVEALLRWDHPSRGPIAPSEFIPVAEQSGLMEELGALALERALHDAKAWPDLYIAVNLSPVQVRDRALVEHVGRLVRETGIDPGRVVLEVTESVLIDDPDAIKARMDELRALGVRLALDDFGSGYSSLAYLRQFPFDKLKIDKGFVAPLGRSDNAGVIIQAIVALGRALGLSVLVEGVETEEQRVLLRLAGCDEMQGFLFARPMSATDIDRLRNEGVAAGVEAREAIPA